MDRKKFIKSSVAAGLGLSLQPFSVLGDKNDEVISPSDSGMWSQRPAEQWQDALVTGNGTMGALVFGDPREERIIFNHEFLYEYNGSEQVRPPDISSYLGRTRELIMEGKYNHSLQRWVSFARDYGDTQKEKGYYESDAKRIVTTWGGYVDDYSACVWSGLIRDYYIPRFEKYFKAKKMIQPLTQVLGNSSR